jgi:DNA polymerase-1
MIRCIDNLNDNLEDAKLLIKLLSSSEIIGLDTETTGLDPFTSKVLMMQINVNDEIFILHRGRLGVKFFTNIIKLINDKNILCVGHNIKFDMKMLRHDTGVWLKNVYDTMIIEAVLTSGLGGKYVSLLDLVAKYCEVYLEKETRLDFLEMNHESSFSERQITYSATDVLYLLDIYSKQMQLAKDANLEKIVKLECEVEPVVAKMEYEGITLDIDYWKKLTADVEVKAIEVGNKLKETLINAIDTSIYENAFQFAEAVSIPVKTQKLKRELESIIDPNMAKSWVTDKFNLHSHKQLLTVLNLIGVKTPDTNEKTLLKLDKNDYVDLILEYRDYEKRLSTYGYNIIDVVNPVTGRIHTDFNQVGTSTGRFSSSGDINMQNIPTHNGYREGFVAKPGYSFVAMDYSQCEYRLTGAVSREPVIIEAYKNKFDMHIATAANFFGKPQSEVTKDERNWGKTRNFEIIYGTTEWGLSKSLVSTVDYAKSVLDKYWEGYPTLSAFKKSAEDMIVKLGYSITPMGRKRYWKRLGAFATPKEIVNHEAKMKREGFNMIIQGGTADVLKVAMFNIDKNNPFGDKFNLLLQVHDELVAEVEDSVIEKAVEFMRYEMLSAFQPLLGEIPAVADEKVSKRWTKS